MTGGKVSAPIPPPDWYDTAAPFSTNSLITDLVDRGATLDPDAPAVLTAVGTRFTHGELRQWSNRFARQLARAGVHPGDHVAFCCARVPEAIGALVGCLRAGAVYVPLEPSWPWQRLHELLSELQPAVLVTTNVHVRTMDELRWSLSFPPPLIVVDADEVDDTVDVDAIAETWDAIARIADPQQAAGFNLTSDDYHTPGDIDEYQTHLADLTAPLLSPTSRVLEVGCGTGLVTQELAAASGSYVGVDPSAVALHRCQEVAHGLGLDVDLRRAVAHEIGPEFGEFDLVVLSSVCQYFPTYTYLARVLETLCDRIVSGGNLVLADVVDPATGRWPGLLRVAPRYLTRIAETHPRIGTIEVRDRLAMSADNSLRLRYDAVLHVANRPQQSELPAPPVAPLTRADIATQDDRGSEPGRSVTDPAYAIYTSGSSGMPKGVVVAHRSVVNVIEWVNQTYRVGPGDTLLFVTSFCFDLSVYDMFGTLAAGAAIRIANDPEVAEPSHLMRILETEAVTFWDSAPAALGAVLPFARQTDTPRRQNLRLVFLSGDWIPVRMPDDIRRLFPRAHVVGLGGATEATVWSNYFDIEEVDHAWPSIPYGRPIRNARYYVLDDELQPAPIGIPGDLFIAGDCLALGYLGDPKLTDDKFQTFAVHGRFGRFYRTGDRARWLSDGNLEFLGRDDNQVKIRGYRVELGEIEARLAAHPNVHTAAVVAIRLGGDTALQAYFTFREQRPSDDDLRAYLREALPAHMLPARFSAVATFLLTSNGKIDRRALADVHTDRRVAGATTNDEPGVLEHVTTAFEDILDVLFVGPSSNFLDLGGTHREAVLLAARLRHVLGRPVGPGDVLLAATPSAIVQRFADPGSGSEERDRGDGSR